VHALHTTPDPGHDPERDRARQQIGASERLAVKHEAVARSLLLEPVLAQGDGGVEGSFRIEGIVFVPRQKDAGGLSVTDP
jgi:hypothetical protein